MLGDGEGSGDSVTESAESEWLYGSEFWTKAEVMAIPVQGH